MYVFPLGRFCNKAFLKMHKIRFIIAVRFTLQFSTSSTTGTFVFFIKLLSRQLPYQPLTTLHPLVFF